jgi:hypothetical protein
MKKQISKLIAVLLVVFFVVTLTVSTASASTAQLSKTKDSQKSITAAMGADGHLQVIYIANDGLPYLIWQDQKGGWHYYGQLPIDPKNRKSFNSVTATMGADGHLQVICIANDGLPYLIWQDQKGGWYYYGQLPYAPIKMIFKYGVGAKNILDTFEGKYTRDMVSCPSVTVSLSLTPQELNTIYQKMNEINFFSYPNKFVVVTNSIQSPYSSYYFKVEYDGNIKELSWDDFAGTPSRNPDRDNVIKLRGLINLIKNNISTKDAYKNLPKPCGGYL